MTQNTEDDGELQARLNRAVSNGLTNTRVILRHKASGSGIYSDRRIGEELDWRAGIGRREGIENMGNEHIWSWMKCSK